MKNLTKTDIKKLKEIPFKDWIQLKFSDAYSYYLINLKPEEVEVIRNQLIINTCKLKEKDCGHPENKGGFCDVYYCPIIKEI